MRASEFINEEINPDVLDPRFSHTQKIGDYTYKAFALQSPGVKFLRVQAFVNESDNAMDRIGQVLFRITDDERGGHLESINTFVAYEYQKKGIASTMYAYAKMLGNDIQPSKNQLPPGKAMWKAWKKSGDAQHLMKENEPAEEPFRIKLGGANEAAKAWIEKVYAKYPSTFQNNHVMMWGEGDAQQFAMFELTPSFVKKGAVEVKWFQAYPLRQGVGSRAMKELQTLARADGISLTLFPWDKGQVSQAKLTKFYRGQGFKPVKKGSKSMAWDHSVNEAGRLMTEDGSSSTTLAQLYNGNYPDRDETFWDYVSANELNTPLAIQTLARHKVMITLLSQYRAEHIDDVMDMLDDDRKELVQSYINDPALSSKVIVVANDRIIDGNHRALAAALKGVPIRYVDLADLEELDDIDEAELDPTGWGATPQGTDVDYFGLKVKMRPSTFLKLSHPLNSSESNPEIEKHMQASGKIAYPFLEIKDPIEWEDGDFSQLGKVVNHEGRNRMTHWIKMKGDEPIQVNIFLRGANRRRYITDDMIQALSQGLISQTGQVVKNPFDAGTALEETVTGNRWTGHELYRKLV